MIGEIFESTAFGVDQPEAASATFYPRVSLAQPRTPQTAASRALILLLLAACASESGPLPTALIHDNQVAFGELTGDTTSIRLEPVRAMWYPETEKDPGATVWAFSADGGTPMIPGPMLRVVAGQTLRVTVVNPDSRRVLSVLGLGARPMSLGDSVRIPAADSLTLTFPTGEAGSYFYSASWEPKGEEMPADEMLLAGALIVDPPTGRTPDRVFLASSWATKVDSAEGAPFVPRDWLVVNGRSFPYNETLQLTQGDTVRWRWLNPSESSHPIHLHGEFFQVTRRGTWAADSAEWGQEVVTQLMMPGSTFEATYVPNEPGNWVIHCHFAFHTSHFLSADRIAEPDDPGSPTAVDHTVMGMRGMMLRIAVAPRVGMPRRAADSVKVRAIRLEARAALGVYGDSALAARSPGATEGMAFVETTSEFPSANSLTTMSSTLVLKLGEPVAITVVNHLRAPTAVHWHGMEVPSWSDGVPGLSGGLPAVAPAIMPGDSFVARFTPTRPGTYMYHAHSNELHQIGAGLYGALIVGDPKHPTPEPERVIVIGGDGYFGAAGRINGSHTPDPIDIPVDQDVRLRLVSISPDWRIRVRLLAGSQQLPWTMVAKDAATIPMIRRVTNRNPWIAGPGETADFVVRIDTVGSFRFLVEGDVEDWATSLTIRTVPW